LAERALNPRAKSASELMRNLRLRGIVYVRGIKRSEKPESA
jgi:hypothetical protein